MNPMPVPPNSLDKAFEWIEAGGILMVRTYGKTTVINAKTVAKFAKLGEWLLREDGKGYRLRSGKKSVYLMPGHLEFANPLR